MSAAEAGTLACFPVAGLVPIDIDNANALVVAWNHDLGPCRRPFGQQAWALDIGGTYEAVAISASTVSATVRCDDGEVFARDEVVELARCCAPNPWANRVMLRLWREVAAHHWPYWDLRAAVSYSDRNHSGDLYRFDGWTCRANNCGSGGGGTWTTLRDENHAARGKRKKLWIWEYPPPPQPNKERQ